VIDEVSTIRPRPLRASAGVQACTLRKAPARLVDITSFHCARVISIMGAAGKTPAFAQRISTPPCRSSAAAAIRSTSSGLPTSAAKPLARPAELIEASGRFVARLPKSLHSRLAARAREEGVSLNTLAIAFIAEGLGHREASLQAGSCKTSELRRWSSVTR